MSGGLGEKGEWDTGEPEERSVGEKGRYGAEPLLQFRDTSTLRIPSRGSPYSDVLLLAKRDSENPPYGYRIRSVAAGVGRRVGRPRRSRGERHAKEAGKGG